MVKIVWKGEDTGDTPGPSFNIWNGIKTPKGVAVEITDPHMIAKARVNKFYQVIEEASQHEEAKVEEPAKVEEQAEQVKETDYRKSEKTSGYSPVKKKSRKRTKPATVAGGIPAPDA